MLKTTGPFEVEMKEETVRASRLIAVSRADEEEIQESKSSVSRTPAPTSWLSNCYDDFVCWSDKRKILAMSQD